MKILCAALLAACAATPAFAYNTITLDFEGAAGYVNPLRNFYNGGTDSLGQSGPNYGVSFSESAVALANDALGPYYSNAPSPLAVMFAFDADTFMNVPTGFVERLAFAYASDASAAGAVNIFSGINGTGDLLASINLSGNATNNCSDTAYCHFDLTGISFNGIARSVSFAGNAPNVLFDDVQITVIPEPASALLLLGGLLAATGVRRRGR